MILRVLQNFTRNFFIYLIFFVIVTSLFCHVTYRKYPRPGDIQQLDLIFPLKNVDSAEIISPFGDARDHGRRLHTGIDIRAKRGTPVLATQSGTIVTATRGRSAGNYIWLLDYRGEFMYEFMHLNGFAAGIKRGKKVQQGETIGYVGNTGNARRTTPHLHFGVIHLLERGYVRGKKRHVDPAAFFSDSLQSKLR